MSSVGAANPGIADLLQTFSSGSAALSPVLSSTAVRSALEVAPPGDLVQLSTQALELQQVAGLFGNPQNSEASLDTGTTATGSPASPTLTPSQTFAEQEAATLFGTDLSTGAGTNTVSLLG